MFSKFDAIRVRICIDISIHLTLEFISPRLGLTPMIAKKKNKTFTCFGRPSAVSKKKNDLSQLFASMISFQVQ